MRSTVAQAQTAGLPFSRPNQPLKPAAKVCGLADVWLGGVILAAQHENSRRCGKPGKEIRRVVRGKRNGLRKHSAEATVSLAQLTAFSESVPSDTWKTRVRV